MGSVNVTVGDVMTTQVQTGRRDQSLHEVWYQLGDEGFHHLPIIDGERVVGMLSERDLVAVARAQGVSKLSASTVGAITAGEVMTPSVETIEAGAPIDEAIERIGRGDLHALVVLDEDDRIAGIVTDRDLLRYLVS